MYFFENLLCSSFRFLWLFFSIPGEQQPFYYTKKKTKFLIRYYERTIKAKYALSSIQCMHLEENAKEKHAVKFVHKFSQFQFQFHLWDVAFVNCLYDYYCYCNQRSQKHAQIFVWAVALHRQFMFVLVCVKCVLHATWCHQMKQMEKTFVCIPNIKIQCRFISFNCFLKCSDNLIGSELNGCQRVIRLHFFDLRLHATRIEFNLMHRLPLKCIALAKV